MKHAASAVAAAALAALPGAAAWGATGHEAIAYVAQAYLTSDTVSWAQNILDDDSDSYLANVAPWADSYRYTSAGRWSAPLHFIDALDDPPHSCSVDYDRDCGEDDCVVAAIGNFTTQLQDSNDDQTTAMKFLVHFLGDIHQPLHDENLDVGGNDIDVYYGSYKTNLHHTWDTEMIYTDAGDSTLADAKSYADRLVDAINNGAYSSAAPGWISDMDLSTTTKVKDTAMSFAQDANSYVCTVVMPNGVDSVRDQDLSGDYYNSAIPTVEELLARAGYRLGAWLNILATGSPN